MYLCQTLSLDIPALVFNGAGEILMGVPKTAKLRANCPEKGPASSTYTTTLVSPFKGLFCSICGVAAYSIVLPNPSVSIGLPSRWKIFSCKDLQ